MKVYISKRSGDLVLAWQVFSRIEYKLDVLPVTPTLMTEWYQYEGIALENKHKVTCVFESFDPDRDGFEYVGEL